LIEGKVILIGNTHPASHDYFLTPFRKTGGTPVGFEVKEVLTDFGAGTPGIEIYANALQTILDKAFMREPGRMEMALFVIAAGVFSTFLFIVLNIRPVFAFMFYLVISLLTFYFSYILFPKVVVALIPVEGVLLLSYIGGVGYHRILALREKHQVTKTFGRYVSHQVVSQLLKEPELVKLGGEKKDLTVLFSDIREFSTISENIDPEDVVKLLNEYFTAMTEIVFKYGGVLDKYMGDAIMAFYGAPIEIKDHADKACLTALEMTKALSKLQIKWKEEGSPVLDIGVGINSGPMVVGNMGSDLRFDYTVVGDSVNLASRLEATNKYYGTKIIVSEFTKEIADDGFHFREIDLVRVKGKNKPVKILELLSRKTEEAPLFLSTYNSALSVYRERDWDSAIALFKQVLSIKPDDRPSSHYINKCAELKKSSLPPDWDGVFNFKTK
jgi:adenylate cyclase